MLISFSVANFRSFKGPQRISFLADRDRAHAPSNCLSLPDPYKRSLLKTGVLVGPNAAGKSNLLLALHQLQHLLQQHSIHAHANLPEEYHPFYESTNAPRPTEFDIELLLDAVCYRYRLSYNADRILFEELRVNVNHKPQRWFLRCYDAVTGTTSWESFSPYLRGEREMWRKATGDKQLFLTTAATMGADQFAPLLDWFRCRLRFSLDASETDRLALSIRLQNSDFRQRALHLMRAADFDVTDIRVVPPSTSRNSVVELLCQRPGTTAVWIPSPQYSSGADRLTNLLVYLLGDAGRGGFLAIDEFDSHLHPLVAKFLLKRLIESSCPQTPRQALLVSDTTALMDLDILRRDEIWLMRLDVHRASELRRLREFGPRRHESIARGYLEGRYGAIPHVSPIDPIK